MENREDLIKESTSIIEEIEDQLDTLLANKRTDIETELMERIEQSRREAKDKMDQLEHEVSEEREVLKGFRLALSEFDQEKREIRDKIKEHLARVEEYQPQIEALAQKTIVELKKVGELNEMLEQLNLDAVSQIKSLRMELKDKVRSVPIPEPFLSPSEKIEDEETEDVQSSLNNELEKLKKFKELLGTNSTANQELEDMETKFTLESVVIPSHLEHKTIEAEPQEESREAQPESEEPVNPEENTGQGLGVEIDKSRKSFIAEKGIKLTYFENNQKLILDVQDILKAIEKDIQNAKNLFEKLDQTQSPKEQFFAKQEIVWHQETLMEFISATLNACETKHFQFPLVTDDIVNRDVLKTILDRLTQDNWSNTDNFSSFVQHFEELKSSFDDKTTSKEAYLNAIQTELERVN